MAEARPFLKMHGLGNDFIVFDARKEAFRPSPEQAHALADRRFGIGCDQLIILEPPKSSQADVYMHIMNSDGSDARACGNATRCIAALVGAEKQSDIVIETVAGLLPTAASNNGLYSADMGPARLEWDQIPLAEPRDTLSIDFELGPLKNPVGVNMGNPHAVFFVEDCEAIDLGAWGPQAEHHPLFPDRANISVVTVKDRSHVRMRVWERGGGITLACGSGACAVGVAAVRRGLTERRLEVLMDGGPVTIEWRESDGHVIMTGPVATSFRGEVTI